jgi:PLD-like domain/DnaJ domain
MEIKAHFSDIHRVIISHLQRSKEDITAAVAWFTDREIFDELCKKALLGVKVSVALLGDDINQGPGTLNFARLRHLGGQVVFLPAGSRTEPIMHHKFCVMDRSTVITGSYNWSLKARSNDENITVATEAPELARQFLDSFANLAARTGTGAPEGRDAAAARCRLEMIRNLILLGEQGGVVNQLRKLRPAVALLKIESIITALDDGRFQAALELIDLYLSHATALVVAETANIPDLRFQLQILELRLTALRDEKAELERRLMTFNRRHGDALGNLIRRVLEARAHLARRRALRKQRQVRVSETVAEEVEAAEGEATAAEEAYRDYSEQHENLKNSVSLPKLDEAAEGELKSFYRKACLLCHPDKVSEVCKDAAQRAFHELQDAYNSNNLAAVKQIYEALQSGSTLQPRSTALTAADSLRAAIAELEHSLARLVEELRVLHNSDGVHLMDAAGASETEWEAFFEQQRRLLTQEISALQLDLAAEVQEASHA